MSDDVIPLLKVHEYFQRRVATRPCRRSCGTARVTHHPAGSVVHEANVLLTTVGFVLRGRLKAVRVDARGTESLFRMIERGEQFGMMVGALAEPVPVRVVALEPTTVLSLDYEQAMELTFRTPDLRRLWLKTYAGSLRKQFFGAAPKRAPMMLALIHDSPATRRAAERLIGRLREVGEKLAVFSDSDEWRGLPGVRFRSLHVDGRDAGARGDPPAGGRVAGRQPHHLRRPRGPEAGAGRAADGARRSGGLLRPGRRGRRRGPPPAGARRAGPRLARQDQRRLAAGGRQPGGPRRAEPPRLRLPRFQDRRNAAQSPWGRSLASGLERLVHDLRGVRIGVALGGGAARGMSHLGVLKALEQNGIVVDMIAGTSAGAMTGIIYASGLDPDYSADQFATDLRPSWIFRHLPRGNHWYLLYKYRRGHFDPMLRKYLHDWRLEQLAVPCLSVTVDLVGGNSVVRERGDAVHAILESINLPVLSVPIVRDGQALIDGGLVNNIPADVLVSMGCNFVIAVSVTAKMEKEFCDITPDKPTPPGRSRASCRRSSAACWSRTTA